MPELFFVSPEFAQLPGIQHAFFTRNLPGSNHVYIKHTFERLKLTGSPEALIQRNCDILIKSSPFKIQNLSILDQDHTNHAVVALTDTHADGQATKQAGVALAVLTADCVPVLLADPKNRVIGSAHAGWKGAISGILENTVLEMNKLGAVNGQITAVLGPCICQDNYEVGPEFVEKLGQTSRLKKSKNSDRWLLDLPGYVCDRLAKLGLKQVLNIHVNTFVNENCLSYRASSAQGKGFEGNLVSVVMLDS